MALYLRSVRKKSLHVIVRLALDRPDVFGLLLERVDVHHPAKYLGHKLSAGRITFSPSGDGACQAELCLWSPGLVLPLRRRKAHVDVRMPLRDAQGNSLVEIVPAGIFRRRIHDPN